MLSKNRGENSRFALIEIQLELTIISVSHKYGLSWSCDVSQYKSLGKSIVNRIKH